MAMDKVLFVHRRKKRYMARLLEDFEANVQPHLPKEVAEKFKANVRGKLNALAEDAVEVITLPEGGAINQVAVEMRDRIGADERRRPTVRSES